MYRNFRIVPNIIFGRGSFNQLDDVLKERRVSADSYMVFVVDDVFTEKPLEGRIPLRGKDLLLWVNVDDEPKTKYIDELVARIRAYSPATPAGIIGIGGGSAMDIAKAVSLMLTNPGSAADYQGWDLIQNPAVYHAAVPTLSGTGAEISRTTILTGPEKKLGINSDYTLYDQILLDPELLAGVPKNQWFYTGMDAYSQVGACHALSYGLSYVLGIHHGIGCCIAFDYLEDIYPEGVREFRRMREKHDVPLPRNLTKDLDQASLEKMVTTALNLVPLWENCLGPDWAGIMTREKTMALYRRM